MKKFIFLFIIIGTIVFYAALKLHIFVGASDETEKTSSIHEEKVEEMSDSETTLSQIETITPEQLSNTSSVILLGTVLSHETANIYPRREGIIQDIYVDIGDEVHKNQIIASLLPRGVEGQSAASIAEKQARVRQSRANLDELQKVANESIQNAEQKVTEKRVGLISALNNQKSIEDQAKTSLETTSNKESSKVQATKQAIEVAKANLKITEEALEKARDNEGTRVVQAQSNISQMLEQAEVSAIHARQTVEQILVGRKGKRSSYSIIYNEIPDEFGATNGQTRTDTVKAFNDLYAFENNFINLHLEQKKEQIIEFIDKADVLLRVTQDLLKSTVSSMTLTQQQITDMANSTHLSQSSLLKSKENIEDAFNAHNVLVSSETETITKLEAQLEQQKEVLIAAEENLKVVQADEQKNVRGSETELTKVETMQDSQIAVIRSQIATLEENVQLVEAKQEHIIEKARNDLEIMEAGLNAELAVSGHQELKSPFSGTVSKRFIEVGQIIMPSMPAFEMVDVTTSLSLQAKREIQFGLPEELNQSIHTGDTIEFFLPENESDVYLAAITRISPQVDDKTHTITIQAKIDDTIDLPHHTSVRVRLMDIEGVRYKMPSYLINRENDQNFLWVLSNDSDQIEKVRVNVLAEDGEFAEVTGKIDGNTRVVLDLPEDFQEQKSENNSINNEL